jgi:hypothetical protein
MAKITAMALLDDVRKIAGVAERLKGPVGNEANTKALLIEPMLSALGWDTTNLDHVLRDWPLTNNSTIDYALRIGEQNAMFVEVRGLNESLDDEPFTAKAVDGTNGEGVLWCVVTNGLIYRVYRTDELVPTNEKLSFEIDLSRAAVGSPADAANVPLLSRESLGDGTLALWSEQKVFTDPRVRVVLSQLAARPTAAFLDAINEAIGEHKVPVDRLRASLGRVLVIETPPPGPRAASATRTPEVADRTQEAPPPPVTRAPEPPQAPAPPAARVEVPPRAPEPPPPAAPPREMPPMPPAPPRDTAPPPPAAPPREPPPAPAAPAAPERPEGETPATDAAQTEAPEAARETSARRRFLGGGLPKPHREEPKEQADAEADTGAADPYGPLNRPGGPFDEVDF